MTVIHLLGAWNKQKKMTLLRGFESHYPQTSKHNVHAWDLYSELVFTYRKIVDEYPPNAQ